MQPRVHLPLKRFLFCLSFTLLGTLSNCDSESSFTVSQHMARAQDAYNQGKLDTSVIELKNALKKNSDYPDARRLLGIIYVELGQGFAAEKELRTALGLGAPPERIVFSLAEALKMQGKNQRILDEIKELPSLDNNQQGRLLVYRGDALYALGKIEASRMEYSRALAIDPTSPLAKLGKATILAMNNKTAEARALVGEALRTSPDEAQLWSFQARLFSLGGKLEHAEASFGKAIDLRKNNQFDRANRALVRIRVKKFEGAEGDIKFLRREAPNFYLAHYLDGLLKIHQKNYEAAQAALETSVKLNSQFFDTYYLLGICHFSQNHFEQAEQEVRRFLSSRRDSVKGQNLLALVKFRQNELRRANEILLGVLKAAPSNIFANNLIGAVEFALNNREKGLEYLKTAVELNPDSAESHLRLGMGKLAAGATPQEVIEFETALEINPDIPEAKKFLALAQIQAREFDKAKKTIDGLKRASPKSPIPWNLLGTLRLAKGESDGAKSAFRKALSLAPGDIIASFYLADMLIAMADHGGARKLYENVIKAHIGHVTATIRLAELDFREGRIKEMESRLMRLLGESPKPIRAKIAVAQHYLRFGQTSRAQFVLNKNNSKHKNNPDILALLAEIQLADRQSGDALETAKSLVDIVPDSARAHYILAETYAANRDNKNLRRSLERSLEIDPKYFPSRLGMVKLSAAEKNQAEALELLKSLGTDFPENAEVLTLQGFLALRQKKPHEAVQAFSAALEKEPSSTHVINLAKAQWQAGDKDHARQTLARWNKKYPKDNTVRYYRSGIYRQLGKPEEVQRQLQAIIDIQPNHYNALNDLAWELREDDPSKALALSEKAAELAPDKPEILDTLGMVLLHNAQNQRALEVIEKAHRLAKTNPSIQYHLALIQKTNRQPEKAVETLKAVLGENRDFPEKKEAEALLSELTG